LDNIPLHHLEFKKDISENKPCNRHNSALLLNKEKFSFTTHKCPLFTNNSDKNPINFLDKRYV